MTDKRRTAVCRKRAVKLNEEQILEALRKYQDGYSLRDLAREYGVSHEYLRIHFTDRKSDIVNSITARKFREKSYDEFCDFIRMGISPEVAAGLLGCTPQAFNELLEKDPEFAAKVMAARCEDLASAEATIANEAKTNWRAALEKVTRAPETREKWKSADTKDQNLTIPIQINWTRED